MSTFMSVIIIILTVPTEHSFLGTVFYMRKCNNLFFKTYYSWLFFKGITKKLLILVFFYYTNIKSENSIIQSLKQQNFRHTSNTKSIKNRPTHPWLHFSPILKPSPQALPIHQRHQIHFCQNNLIMRHRLRFQRKGIILQLQIKVIAPVSYTHLTLPTICSV